MYFLSLCRATVECSCEGCGTGNGYTDPHTKVITVFYQRMLLSDCSSHSPLLNPSSSGPRSEGGGTPASGLNGPCLSCCPCSTDLLRTMLHEGFHKYCLDEHPGSIDCGHVNKEENDEHWEASEAAAECVRSDGQDKGACRAAAEFADKMYKGGN